MVTPVVFKSPGSSPDTCLMIFGQEFHTESTTLRLHSGFFRTFLTTKSAIENTSFKYDYVSKVDKDRTWGLQPKSSLDTEGFKNSTVDPEDGDNISIRGFGNLLRAIYSQRYHDHHFDSFYDLIVLVRLADFYRALPVVSLVVEASLFPDCHIVGDMSENYVTILNLAYQLRAPKLFREAFIFTVGRAYRNLEEVLSSLDGRLHGLIHKYLAELSGKISDACHELHEVAWEGASTGYFDPLQLIYAATKAASGSLILSWTRGQQPQFYRFLLEASYRPTNDQCRNYDRANKEWISPTAAEEQAKTIVNGIVGPLMVNNMCYQNGTVVGKNFPYFLFTKLLDQDLPWDPEETDW